MITGRLTSDAADDAETEADGLLDPLSAPLMSSGDLSSPPPQAVSKRAAAVVSAAAVVVSARRATGVPPRVIDRRRACVRQGTKLSAVDHAP
ncbi:uncharacterized protein SAZU_8037 [Streptomyces azureus]|uniref:Uncharacterized protein n=1 Tax=Streptomyces azureus TaxID=146537 RepID=A0A0K8PZD1_STRAJ|nr:uncharacterized protein SAZU_8037 [Streptomyces azureus]